MYKQQESHITRFGQCLQPQYKRPVPIHRHEYDGIDAFTLYESATIDAEARQAATLRQRHRRPIRSASDSHLAYQYPNSPLTRLNMNQQSLPRFERH